MNLLDENFPADQLPLLRGWHIPVRKIGREVSHLGIGDPDIIPLLHRLRHVTFFTQDRGFFDADLRHSQYCLVWLDVPPDAAALFIRRLLRLPRFDTAAKRMGLVVRAHPDAAEFWQPNRPGMQYVAWPHRA